MDIDSELPILATPTSLIGNQPGHVDQSDDSGEVVLKEVMADPHIGKSLINSAITSVSNAFNHFSKTTSSSGPDHQVSAHVVDSSEISHKGAAPNSTSTSSPHRMSASITNSSEVAHQSPPPVPPSSGVKVYNI